MKDDEEPEAPATVADTPRTRATASALDGLPSRFTVKQTLGEGGMGTVVEAYDRVLGRDVAIKLLAHDRHDPQIGARFLREARAAAQIRHPGIVQVHDIDADGAYIVMELVRGESLATKLWREGKLPVDEVRRIAGSLLAALAVAHAQGIVHRDVKPANVLLGEGGEIKLADFGVAHFTDSELTIEGTQVGTPAYMAPEQLRGKHVDARADVYAVGITLYEAAVGERPNEDLGDPYTTLAAATGDAVLAEAVRRAIRERAAERFSDAAAFATALEATEVPTPPPPAKLVRASRPARRWVVAGLAAVALAGGAGALALDRDGESTVEPAPAAVPRARRAIALLPFADATGNAMLDFASAGLPNLLGLELAAVPDVTVIGYYQLVGIAGKDAPPAAWVAAAKQLGADVVIRGDLAGTGDTVHVSIAIDTIDGSRLDTIERDARVEDVPETVRRAAAPLAKLALGRELPAGSGASPAFAAERALQLGIAALDRERIEASIEHLRAAIHHAPDLALAHYYLAVALSWRTPPPEPARAEIELALKSGALDEAQRGVLKGVERIVEFDYAGGIEVLRPLSERFPQNRDILYALFESLFHGGRPAEAISVYRRIIAIAPKYRLALVHVFTFHVSRGDETGMGWALSLNDPTGDTYNAIWEPRVMVARRDYAGAIERLSRSIEKGAPDQQSELIIAYALDNQVDLAVSLARKTDEAAPGSGVNALLGLATARGDAVERARLLDGAMRAYATMPPGSGRAMAIMLLAGAQLPVASRAELAAIDRALTGALVPTYERSLNYQLAEVLVAEALDQRARLDKLARGTYPEVTELAKAAIARAAGDRGAAATATRRSIAATGDARFLVTQWWKLAGDLRATSDHAGVVAACDEVIRPRLVLTWAWGSAVGECLAWTGDAAEALGDIPKARAAWTRLRALRKAAPKTDPLVTTATAALARLK